MLYLERKVGEWIHIGSDIRVKLHKVKGCKATLAIDAPKTTLVYRAEFDPTRIRASKRIARTCAYCRHARHPDGWIAVHYICRRTDTEKFARETCVEWEKRNDTSAT